MDPKAMLIPVTLKGPNYLLWSRIVTTTLRGKGMDLHLTKSEAPAPTDKQENLEEVSAKELKWIQDDSLVLTIIRSSLEVSILEAYSYCDTAKELWDTLHKVYGNTSNLSRVYEIKKLLSQPQQGMEFTYYFGKFRSLWAELDVLRPSTIDPLVLNERKEQDKVFGLLLTLDPEYGDLIKHVLRGDKLPTLEDLCSQIQKEQGTLGLFGGKEGLQMAHKVEVPQANKAVPKPRDAPICDHCKKKGHKKERCWNLYPELKPMKFREDKAHSATNGDELAMTARKGNEDGFVRKSDLEALFQRLHNNGNESGKSFHTSSRPSSFSSLIIDSGASHHMINNSCLLKDVKPTEGNVVVANGEKIPIKGVGYLDLFDKPSRALYMPSFTSNLLSVNQATNDLDCNVIFGPNEVTFQDIKGNKVLGKGVTKGGLYLLNEQPMPCALSTRTVDDKLWHARLGHPHSRALSLVFPSISLKHIDCEACILGKHCKTVFPKSTTIYENCFDLVHSDVWTAPCVSRDNHRYFVTFIDEKSKYTWITLLPSKDRVFEAFVDFHNYATNHFNAKIKVFRSDNGGEFTSNVFKQHLAKHGILHQTSCPYTPQQNGVAERKNRHLMEVARSMMFHTHVPKRFWGDAVVTACYLINRLPTRILDDISPYEVLNKLKPSLDHLRVFGCLCFVLNTGEQRNKLEARSTRAMFLGYSSTQKGYKCFDPITRRVLVSRDVRFVEDKSHFVDGSWADIEHLTQSPGERAETLRTIFEGIGLTLPRADERTPPAEPVHTTPPLDHEGGNMSQDSTDSSSHDQDEEFVPEENQDTSTLVESGEDSNEHEELVEGQEQEPAYEEPRHDTPPPLRRSQRIRNPPSNWVKTRVFYNNKAVAHPIQEVCSMADFPHDHQAFITKLDKGYVPKSYEEAKEYKEWREAIENETKAMMSNETWIETNLPKGKKAVTSKWVFTIKYKSNGDIERYKARLVARGFTQTYGEDYLDTFAPVAKLHTVRIVLSLATNLGWELWQMDVKNAFLQGELEEEVYMRPPPGLKDSIQPGNVLRLKKAIYGLKQSPRAWYHKLSSTLVKRGFERSEADHTLFKQVTAEGIVVILVYVDDIIITGNDKSGIHATKLFLKSSFDIKDLGELKYFLGIEICRSNEGLFLSQRKYTLDLLSEVGKLGVKPAKTPLEDGYKVIREGEFEDQPHDNAEQYRRMVGKLIYLTITRPDICFAVNQVSQHMQSPKKHHWHMVERILRYLKGSPCKGIWMGCNGSTEITGYCDADWAGDKTDRRSTTGYCTFIGGNLVTWKSKKQTVVSCSSAEAEYRAMRNLTNELIWIKALLKDLGMESSKPITMHCDNQAAIHIASNSVFHERTKHIEVDCHKVRQMVEQGVILPCYTRSEDQLADVFTKAASLKVYESILPKLGLISIRRL